MGKRAVLTAVLSALIALAAVAAPAAASWTHKGKGELKENASLTLTGELTLSTSAGNVSCPTTIGATLTASGSSGDVNSFTVSNPSECDLTGSLAAICGTHGVTKVEQTGTWALTAEESDIAISELDVHYVMAGCLIPSFRLKGSATASVDKATAIGSATLSGTQTIYNALGEESGSGELKGTLSVSPAGTYGVKTAPMVETIWTDGNSHLSEDGKLTLAGTFSFSGSDGSVSCPATIKLLLESSTVEEEEPEGEIESFAVAKASECDLGGNYKTLCGTNAISKVEQTGTATLTATEADIKVAGLVLDYEFEKCAITTLRVEGSPTLTPAKPELIGSATFSAGGLEIYNSKAETLGTASAGGSTTASPSGTFQLASDEALTIHEEKTETEATKKLELFEGRWRTGGVNIGNEANKDAVHLTGTLSWTKSGLKTSCDATTNVELWNTGGKGHGRVTSLKLTADPTETGGCTVGAFVNPNYVDVPNCHVNGTSEGFPWTITTSGTNVVIHGANFTNEFVGAGCLTYLGIPAGTKVKETAKAEGVTGTFAAGAISFSNSGHFTGGATIDGSLGQ